MSRYATYSPREFEKILRLNGYEVVRQTGSHRMYKNDTGDVIPCTLKPNKMVVRRMIKEHNLKVK